jgi:UDP-glucose 4-epimerase
MKILVTGGAGYIGSHVVIALCEGGYEVVVLDDLSTGNREAVDNRAEFIQGSTLNNDNVATALNGVDAVIHLAAFKAAGESMIDPGKYSQNNISGTISLLNAMITHGVDKFIFSSTAAVYGYPKYLPLDENHPLEPINYYGFTKLEIERILKWYGELKGLKFAALRYFNAAGYDPEGRIRFLENNPANLIPIVMEVASGRREKMEVFGNDYDTSDGTGVRDYIHVTDLASAHVKAIEYLKTNDSITVNLATGESHSVLDVINKTKDISGKNIPYHIVDRRPGDPAELYAGTTLAFDQLDWKANHSGLKSLIETTWQVYK